VDPPHELDAAVRPLGLPVELPLDDDAVWCCGDPESL
jgi:hypothetical protein